MKAARFPRPLTVEFVDLPSPPLKPGEVRLKIARCAICGSDVRRFQNLIQPGVFPIVVGHECSGTVVESASRSVDVGQRAAIVPIAQTCGQCPACLSGHINYCQNQRRLGPTMQGAFAEELVVHESMIQPIPHTMTFDEAALAEPTSIAVHGANRAGIKPGDRVAVLGAGAIGLLLIQVARAKGASHVLATGRTEKKLRLARELGADVCVDVTREDAVTPERAQSFDAVIDLVCDQSTVDQGLALAGWGSRVIFIASPSRGSAVQISLNDPNLGREILVGKSSLCDSDYREVVPLVASGKVRTAPLITHRFPLSEVEAALHTAIEDRRDSIKIVIEP
jgi:L-iditol 2-dehydrogenase